MKAMCVLGLHQWEGCKCQRCCKTRTEGHDWSADCERCNKCYATRAGAHTWHGCKCKLCGKERYAGHIWKDLGCLKECSTCKQTVYTGTHVWQSGTCANCGWTKEGRKKALSAAIYELPSSLSRGMSYEELIQMGRGIRTDRQDEINARVQSMQRELADIELASERPKPTFSSSPASLVDEAKDMIRKASGAREFLLQASRAGWRKINEDFIGIYLQKRDATLIFGVLPSQGPDRIYNAMMTTEERGTVYLITEGEIAFADRAHPS
jgi:hypothetical protein